VNGSTVALLAEQMYAYEQDIMNQIDYLELQANRCENDVDSTGQTVCVFPDGTVGTLDLTDFTYAVYETDSTSGERYKVMSGNLNDDFWSIAQEFSRYDILTTDNSGDVLNFSLNNVGKWMLTVTRLDGSQSTYTEGDLTVTHIVSGQNVPEELTFKIINDILTSIDYDDLYDQVENDPIADIDVNTDGTVSIFTPEGTEMRYNVDTLELTEMRDGNILGTYDLATQLGVFAAFVPFTPIDASFGTVTIDPTDLTFTVDDYNEGLFFSGDSTGEITIYSEVDRINVVAVDKLSWENIVELVEVIEETVGF